MRGVGLGVDPPPGVGVVRGRPISGVGRGVAGEMSISTVGVGEALARGVGVAVGEGVGVGVFTFALTLRFVVERPELTLKLKFESNPILVFRFEFMFVLTFRLALPAWLGLRSKKITAPIPTIKSVPSMVRTTTLNVFCCDGGG